MDRELRILLLEDSPADATLLERTLRKGGLAFEVNQGGYAGGVHTRSCRTCSPTW